MDPDLGLLIACRNGNFDQARSFVDQGGNIVVQDKDGNTPFHLAAKHGQSAFSLLSYFVEKGAKTKDDRILIIKNNEGVSIFKVLQSFNEQRNKKKTTKTYSTNTLFVES